MKAAARSPPPTTRSPRARSLSSSTSPGTTSRAIVVFHPAEVRVLRIDHLGHVPPDPGELLHGRCAPGVQVGGRPESGHELVGDPSVQEGSHHVELLDDVGVELVIDHVPVDLLLRSLEEAVQGNLDEEDHLSHREFSRGRQGFERDVALAVSPCQRRARRLGARSASSCAATPGVTAPIRGRRRVRRAPARQGSWTWRRSAPERSRRGRRSGRGAGLDPESARTFEELIRHLNEQLGLTIFVVTRDLGLLWNAADQVAFLGAGRVVAAGTMEEASRSTDPLVRSYFSGMRGGARREQR